jgi:glucan phosphoethanolaminetransferase (alkaline phosphatase superfamily)
LSIRVFWSLVIVMSSLIGETYFLIVDDRLTIEALDAMWDPQMVDISIPAFYGVTLLEAVMKSTVLLAGLLVPPPQIRRLASVIVGLVPIVPCVLIAGVIFHVGGQIGHETRGMPSQFLAASLMAVRASSAKPTGIKGDIAIPLLDSPGPKHIILIIDESVSGDFIDLNVDRGTTPYLLSQKSSIINFGLGISASNCSDASNAVMRLGANPETLGKTGHNIFTNPSVWKYAAAAGYKTHYLEAQDIIRYKTNFVTENEIGLIDQVWAVPQDISIPDRDLYLIRLLKATLASKEPQFILINKRGSHFPYSSSYPRQETVFSPAMSRLDAIAGREQLVNSYKNAIRWSVDHFFKTLFTEIDLTDSVLIYTSDHGQNLLDDGRPVTHCRRTYQSLFEAVIPLLVWTDNENLKNRFALSAGVNYNRTSHFQIFPTVLMLLGYDPEQVRKRYFISLFDRVETPLGFTTGSITGRFGRGPVWNSAERLEQIKR